MVLSLFKPNPDRLLAKRNLEGLVKAVRYKHDSKVRAKAAAALGSLGGPRAVEALIQAFADEAPEVRASAAQGLNEIDDPKAVEALIRALEDKASEVRALAARNLMKIGDSKVVTALIQALADEAPEVRGSAARGLTKVDDSNATAMLIKALADDVSEVRAMAARCLNKIGNSKAAGALAEYKPQHCMLCGGCVLKSDWVAFDGTLSRNVQQGLGGFDFAAVMERTRQTLMKERANCKCGAVLCVGCTPSGGWRDLPVCEFCGADLNWHRFI